MSKKITEHMRQRAENGCRGMLVTRRRTTPTLNFARRSIM